MLGKIFGASWVTSLMGYLVAAGIELQIMMKEGSPFPSTTEGWVSFLIAFASAVWGRASRQTNVSSEAEGVK